MNTLETALELLASGFWPVPITANDDPNTLSPGKAPIGHAWGVERHTPESLRAVFEGYLPLRAGVGLKLGPEAGVVDFEVEDREAGQASLLRLFGGELPETLGWDSTRGGHHLFRWDDQLKRYGKAIVKHRDLPGVELRLGYHPDGKQYQSVCPPSPSAAGKAREWNGFTTVLPVPDSVYEVLDDLLLTRKPTPGRRPVIEARQVKVWDAETRAVEYLKKCEPAIAGERGHDKAFKAACKVGPGFDLAPEVAYRLLAEVYNPTCEPPWNERELRHKVDDAYKVETRRGWLLGETNGHAAGNGDGHAGAGGSHAAAPAEAFDDPFRMARSFLAGSSEQGIPTLRYWLEEWHQWDGRCYRVVPATEVKGRVVAHVKDEFDRLATLTDKPPAKVTTGVVGNVMQALASLALLTQIECRSQPAWLDDGDGDSDLPAPLDVIPARNGLICLPALVEGRQGLSPSTPRFFSPNCLEYDFDQNAPRPGEWLAFLGSIWPDDPESIQALQEWFGYLLTPDTRQQKILVLIGPTRSGKGTIARVVSALVGERNVASPTLSSLANNFGLAPLIGKTVAVFPDARLSGRSDSQVIVERLLSISGEDSQTIDRKHLSSWGGKLTTRFVLISNELPRLGDSSGAITARTVILRMTESFLGREDTELHGKLMRELPSILLWAIAGWARLRRRGRFLTPASGLELLEDLKDLSSPVGTFIEEECEQGPEHSVPCSKLFAAWKTWCGERGKEHPGDEPGFGRSLHAALPRLRKRRPLVDGKRVREYVGIALKGTY